LFLNLECFYVFVCLFVLFPICPPLKLISLFFFFLFLLFCELANTKITNRPQTETAYIN
jgi:hypothetical protein